VFDGLGFVLNVGYNDDGEGSTFDTGLGILMIFIWEKKVIDIRPKTVQNRKETQWINSLSQSYITFYRLSDISDIYYILSLNIN
jgi:hypothetical protein